MTSSAPQHALVPAIVRRPVLAVIAGAALVLAVLGARYARTSAAGRADGVLRAIVDPVVVSHGQLNALLVELASPDGVVPLSIVLATVCLFLGRRRLAVLAVLGPGLTGVCTSLLKPAVGRTLSGDWAFPSGHTGGATSLGLVAALLLVGILRPGRTGWLTVLAATSVVIGGGVATALVATDAHYPTDTVGGFCTAIVVVLGTALALDRLATRWAGRRSAEPAPET